QSGTTARRAARIRSRRACRSGMGVRSRGRRPAHRLLSGLTWWRMDPHPSVLGGKSMRKLLLLAATAAMAFGASQALSQEKKQLVIVVKGLDNPFFEAINQGCQKWNSENASSEYECFYTGPASTSDEAGEAQIVQDMLGKPSTAAIAISPSNAKLIAQSIRTANPTVPVMTLDADLAKEDAALRKDRKSVV